MQLTPPATIASLAVLLACATAAAQPATGARLRGAVYQDDDATTIVTAGADVDAAIEDTVALRAGYLVDVTTSASVDVVTAATDRWTERRDEIRGGADLYAGSWVVSADYARSLEADWSSHKLGLGAAVNVADNAATLSLGLGLVLNDVGRAGEDGAQGAFAETQTGWALNLGWVQVLDERSVLSLRYAGQVVTGFQSSPYRYVALDDGTVFAEAHPDLRHRHALVAQYRHALDDEVAIGVDQRLYADSWSVLGTTTAVRIGFGLSDAVDLELENRFHLQRGASFYADRYAARQLYLSGDRELSTFLDDFFGPKLVVEAHDLGPLSRLTVDVAVQGFVYRYFEFEELPWRLGFVASLGVGGEL